MAVLLESVRISETAISNFAIIQLFERGVAANRLLEHIATHTGFLLGLYRRCLLWLAPFIGHPCGITQCPLSREGITRISMASVGFLVAKIQGTEPLAELALEELVRRRSQLL